MQKLLTLALASIFNRINVFSQCQPATAINYLDVNNVKATILNGGDLWWGDYFVPKDSMISKLDDGSIWIGGIDHGGQLRIAAQTYRQNGNDFFPGAVEDDGSVPTSSCNFYDNLWKVSKSTIDSFTSGLFSYIPFSILDWPGRGNPNNGTPMKDLAPFNDVNLDGIYNPVDGDYPCIKGDQALWWIFNDVGSHIETQGASMHVEIKAMAYSFKGSGVINNTTFYQYHVTGKPFIDDWGLDTMYFGFWADPDLGCLTDGYFGCDTSRNLCIAYDPYSTDTFCANPNYHPEQMIGFRMVGLPSDTFGNSTPMHSFITYTNDFSVNGNPENADDYWYYLTGRWKDGSAIVNPDGNTTTFEYPDSPDDPAGWSQCLTQNYNSDQRMVMGFGPMTLEKGESKDFTLAVIWKAIPDSAFPCPSFSYIQNASDSIQNFFNNYSINCLNTGIVDVKSSKSFSIFPNPASDEIHLNFALADWKNAGVFDMTGKELIKLDLNGHRELTVNIGLLERGIYFISARNDSGVFTSRKLIVQ